MWRRYPDPDRQGAFPKSWSVRSPGRSPRLRPTGSHGTGVRGGALPIGECAARASPRWHTWTLADRGSAARSSGWGSGRPSSLVSAIRPDLSPSASLMAVLPFTPSGSDTALSRLGRDLVFTMSSELDGLGTIRVVDAHTVLAQAKPGGLYSPAEGAALARRFGAGSMVHGSLVREGADVRLDFVLLSTDGSAAPLARASVIQRPRFRRGAHRLCCPRSPETDLDPRDLPLPRASRRHSRPARSRPCAHSWKGNDRSSAVCGTAPRPHTAAPGRRIRPSGWPMPASSMPALVAPGAGGHADRSAPAPSLRAA